LRGKNHLLIAAELRQGQPNFQVNAASRRPCDFRGLPMLYWSQPPRGLPLATARCRI
jgi:hypothetical protein